VNNPEKRIGPKDRMFDDYTGAIGTGNA